ncbi:MAG: hypothetical protein ACREPF_10655, partial [Rhodanobacteraceae bacterium]
SLDASRQRLRGADAAAAATQGNLTLSEKLRGLGEADGLQLADVRLALVESELDREQARLAHGLAFVALYKALGGAPLPASAEDAACSALPRRDADAARGASRAGCTDTTPARTAER